MDSILTRDHHATALARADRAFGPKQQASVKHNAEMLALWAIDLQRAAAEGDVAKVTSLAGVIAKTADGIDRIADRAHRVAR